jgi:hypothetical protein
VRRGHWPVVVEEGGAAAVEVEDGSDARIEGGSSGHAWPPAAIRCVEGDSNQRSGRDDNVGWEGVGGGAAGGGAGGGERCCLRVPEMCSHGSAARDVLPAQASWNIFGLLAAHRQEEEDKDRCGLLALYCWTTENSL